MSAFARSAIGIVYGRYINRQGGADDIRRGETDMNFLKIIQKIIPVVTVTAAVSTAVTAQTVIDNVNVIAMDGKGVQAGMRVVIEGDRVTAVGAKAGVGIPAGSKVIDGAGKYLIPGLAEMHGHIPPVTSGEQAIEDTLFLYVSNGVTTVRGMLGTPGQLELREKAKSGDIVAPTLYLAGPSFNGNSVSSPKQAGEKVAEQVTAGWDLLKVHPGLTRPEYDAMAKKAHALGIGFGGHIPADVGLLRALEAKQRTIDHVDGFIIYLDGAAKPIEEAKVVEAARMTKAAGVGIVPTQALWRSLIGASDPDFLRSLPELKYMSKATIGNWMGRLDSGSATISDSARVHQENRQKLLKAMADEGVELLFGTDAPQIFSVPGFSIHHEAATMVDAGLTPAQVLNSATVAVGKYFEDKDTFGMIVVGHRADLILLDSNPLENIENLKNPVGVAHRGHWINRETIQARLAEIEARHK